MDRSGAIRGAYEALNGGDVDPFRALLAPEAQWLGVPGRSWTGDTAI